MNAPTTRHRRAPALLAINALLLLAVGAAGLESLPAVARMLAAGLAVLVLPGVGWLGLFRGRPLDPPRLALAVVGMSSVACVAGLGLEAALSGAPSRALVAGWLFAVTNLGLLAAGPPRRLDRATPWGLLLAVAGVGFVLTALSGTRLVPPLEDHDMEVRGTAWGLASDFKPYFLTNREVFLPMAHPPLFHFQVAESLVLTGQIGATRRSYDSARRAQHAVVEGRDFPWMDTWRADYEAFVAEPALAGTRAPSAVYAALLLALLCDLVRRLTGQAAAGVTAAVLFLSCPETVVRAAYAGYFSETVFAMLIATMLFEPRAGKRASPGWLVAAGAFAALVDHKTVVLILAVAAVAAARVAWSAYRSGAWRPAALWRALDKRVVALGTGFSAATFLWWGYGLILDPRTLLNDHLRMHIVHRFLLNDVRLATDPRRYAPSIPQLWLEFNQHTGYLLLPVALIGVVAWLLARDGDDRTVVLSAWILMGSLLYSLTDWRQTKHLMNQLAPLVAAAVVVAWPVAASAARRRLTRWRVAATAALGIAFAFNLVAVARLLHRFGSLVVHGASDIDGW